MPTLPGLTWYSLTIIFFPTLFFTVSHGIVHTYDVHMTNNFSVWGVGYFLYAQILVVIHTWYTVHRWVMWVTLFAVAYFVIHTTRETTSFHNSSRYSSSGNSNPSEIQIIDVCRFEVDRKAANLKSSKPASCQETLRRFPVKVTLFKCVYLCRCFCA